MRVAVASRNPGKLAELGRLLDGHPWELVGLDAAGFAGELEEPHDTYEENAAAKALAVCAATGLASLADELGDRGARAGRLARFGVGALDGARSR